MLRLRLCAALVCAALAAGCRKAPEQSTLKYGVRVQAGPMDSILLKDYAPKTSLVVPETAVAKARFPVIDVHSHSKMNGIKTSADVAAWVKTMDEVGVETSVVFLDAVGEEFDRASELFKPYGGRFVIYCSLDTRDIEAPDYPQRAVRELERCYAKGARGVGELSDKGWGLQGAMAALDENKSPVPRAKRMHADDPRLDPFFEKCADLKLPVNMHIADHPSCWQPLGPNQERTPDFQHFNMLGKDVPSYEELLASRDRMLEKHPRTTVIACHLGNQGNDLASLAKVLDRYPNLYVDISARDYELGRQPRNAARFLARYSGRVLYGTDMGLAAGMYRGWWRLLETGDEFIPGRIWWRYYGLELPPDLLEKIYRGNARRVLNWGK